jgi:hypothetical protein
MPVTRDEAGQVVSHAPAASCASFAKLEPATAPPEKPCCRFFGVGNTMYKGVYLPSVEEYVAHGYMRENFGEAMRQWHASIDATGRP